MARMEIGNVLSAQKNANFKNINFETLVLYKTLPISCKEFLKSFWKEPVSRKQKDWLSFTFSWFPQDRF